MNQVRLAWGLPCCQNPQDIQTKPSIGLRLTAVLLGILTVIIGALSLLNIPGFSHLGTPGGWTFISIGTFLILIGISVKGVKKQNESLFITSEDQNRLIHTCVELYKKNEDAWVMVPPQRELQEGKQPVIAIGSASYEGVGNFKIHISVDPTQMEQAIPIVLKVLHQEGAPTVGLKFQTEHMLLRDHQVGKEFALLFAADAEKGEESTHAIKKLLSQIQAAFIEQGINPEKGLVLTATTREQIASLPEGQQSLEKRNLQQKKFDRGVPGSTYFYYRHDDFTAIADSEDWAVEMNAQERKAQKMILFSEMDQILLNHPESAHNPLDVKDPFRNLHIA